MNTSSVKYLIYPAIGIARVGNSDTEHLISPEVSNQALETDINYKDKEGRVKPQAAKFRIYAIDLDGNVIEEVTADNTQSIEWRVHLANRKAINYEFQNAMDLGKQLALDCPLRNANITEQDERRRKLLLDSGVRSISGRSRAPSNAEKTENFCFDSARFFEGTTHEQKVYLGQLRTDEKGRLLVLGGQGKSASFDGKPAVTFANNDGWYDDVSDGTVRASITINGEVFEAEPAMVAVTPPNFAPGIQGAVTMYDVVADLFEKQGMIESQKEVDFYRDIYPIFKSLVDNQAVNAGFYFSFGENSPADFTSKALLPQLSSNDPAHLPLRQKLFKQFRPSETVAQFQRIDALAHLPNPSVSQTELDQLLAMKEMPISDIFWDKLQHLIAKIECMLINQQKNVGLTLQVGQIAKQAISESQEALEAEQLPPFYGDTYGDFSNNPLANLSLTDKQYRALKYWADGDFVNNGEVCTVGGVDDLDLQNQPSALTQGHLAQCLGGPFHPGIELTWFLRLISMWNTDNIIDKMRLNILPETTEPEDYYGPVLTPDIALAQMFNASGPGTLTRFMGIPWQTDEASCRSGQDYDPAYYLPLASFWSARVPNQVLSQRSLERLNDPSLPPLQRLKHLDYRQDWLRFFNSTHYQTQINGMVQDWDKIGIVKQQSINPPLTLGSYELSSLWVESEVSTKFTVNDPSYRELLHMEGLTSNQDVKNEMHAGANHYQTMLRKLEQDDINFANSDVKPRQTFTRKQLFGGNR
ncbi:LodA/GoxA family CTQ-dependent oxidase [uncultured Shewanella sp.]|uniref:LodA/GoxA family CTQ-dependent oxidase n=1 Tax=uncultured Shewanella sp. TaxID=173975 RepID=UPI0026384378|nr:LodA/GoxA family CTQ-dependent oxidase [uncultured Shewanella sp.]